MVAFATYLQELDRLIANSACEIQQQFCFDLSIPRTGNLITDLIKSNLNLISLGNNLYIVYYKSSNILVKLLGIKFRINFPKNQLIRQLNLQENDYPTEKVNGYFCVELLAWN